MHTTYTHGYRNMQSESGEPPVQQPAPSAANGMSMAGKRILLVEDEALITMLIVDVLEDLGVTVIGPAETLAHALELAQDESIDAAILDVNLGSETSFPVASLLRARRVPYLYTTAFANKSHPEMRDDPFLSKPYGLKQLLVSLQGLLQD